MRLDEDIISVVGERTQKPSSQALPDPSVVQRWSDLETTYLINACKEKWYLLKRGQLKARHWEEIANHVFLRCGGSTQSKSSVQCQHKIENLRKRYRIEKQLEELKDPDSSSWPFFKLMDAMEQDEEYSKRKPVTGDGNGTALRSTRIHFKFKDHSTRDAQSASPSSKNDSDDTSPPPVSKARNTWHSKEHATNAQEKDSSHGGRHHRQYNAMRKSAVKDDIIPKLMKTDIASVVKGLGNGFLNIELMKLEVQRDNERLRAEVELRRTSMLLDAQRQIAEMFAKSLPRKKGVKKRPLQEL